MPRIRSTTKRKLEAIYESDERRHLLLIRKHITQPLGDWHCQPNPYLFRRRTAKLTGKLPSVTITMPTEVIDG